MRVLSDPPRKSPLHGRAKAYSLHLPFKLDCRCTSAVHAAVAAACLHAEHGDWSYLSYSTSIAACKVSVLLGKCKHRISLLRLWHRHVSLAMTGSKPCSCDAYVDVHADSVLRPEQNSDNTMLTGYTYTLLMISYLEMNEIHGACYHLCTHGMSSCKSHGIYRSLSPDHS